MDITEIKPTATTEWFRKLNPTVPAHFNQSIMYRCTKRLNHYTFRLTIQMLCAYHDALRSIWDGRQIIIRKPAKNNMARIEEYDLRRSTDINADMLPLVQNLQSTIDLNNGPLVQVGHFHLPEYDAVFMTFHRLIIDGVSFRIITENLNSIYPQFLGGAFNVRLPKIRCSMADYAEAVHKFAISEELSKELPYWTDISEKVRELARNFSPTGETDYAYFNIEEKITHRMLTECKVKYGVEVDDLLLTALSRAWKHVTGLNQISLSLWHHGRNSFGGYNVEMERTVGWFTGIYPVLLDCQANDISKHVRQISTTMHSIPNNGFGYGTLLHITHIEELDCIPLLSYNYYGSYEEGGVSDNIFTIDHELPQGDLCSPLNSCESNNPLFISSGIIKGCLSGSFSYDKGIFSEEKAQSLMKEFEAQLALL